MIHPAESDDEDEKEEDTDKAVAVKDDPQFTIAVTRGEHLFQNYSYWSMFAFILLSENAL